MKKYLKYMLFLVLIVCLGFLYSFSASKNGQKKVQNPEIEFEAGNNGFLTHQMVNKLLIQNQQEVKNQRKSIIDLQGLEKNVLSNPYVEKATVFLTIDGLLKTTIKQRTPIVRVQNKETSFYLDEHGVEVPISSHYAARVPIISGVERKDIKDVMRLMKRITQDDFLKKEIIGIQKNKNQEYEFNVRSGDYKIDFGKLENEKTKFLKLKAFYNKAFKDKTIENYKTISLKFHNQVVCTK